MPAFQAINLEPEENVDEQIDTTKELHVDEALKRFQTALRLHAQGPRSRDAAAAAYEELFESEIFKYREATSDYERAEAQANGEVEPQALELFSGGLDVDAGGADGVAATLSLTLYLGYKNYGEFFLDKLKDLRKSDSISKSKLQVLYHQDGGDKVLDNWAKALDQDPSDPEVWRRAARFAAALNSTRLKRYCLEAAIELDDDPAVAEVEPPSIAEGLAGEQLKEQLELLGDKMALSHPVLSPWVNKDMPAIMKRHLDPIPFLPDPTQTLTPPPSSPAEASKLLEDGDSKESRSSESTEAKPVSSWSQLGKELMKHLEETTAPRLACESGLEASPDTDMASAPNGADVAEDQEGNQASQNGNGDDATKASPQQGEDAKGRKKSDATAEKGEHKETDKPQLERSQSAPTTRKRSQSVAGLADGADEAVPEKRSKRVRRRETADTGEPSAPTVTVASQLQPYQEADHNLFHTTMNILENLGVEDKGTIDRLAELQDSSGSEDRMAGLTALASKDLRTAMANFSEETARVLLNKEEKASLGLSSFLEHAKTGSQDQTTNTPFDERKGIKSFTDKVNQQRPWMTGGDTAFEWVWAISKSYAEEKWSDEMKTTVVQMLNHLHAGLYERITEEIELSQGSPDRLADLETLVPMLFELHVDIYERITNPSSVVDYATRVETKDRLGRWLNVASAFVRILDRPAGDPVCVRFMWASVLTASHAEEPVREHMLMMWTSLRDFLAEEKVDPIPLPNNVVMPIISAGAADREISKLTTMDFFLGLFQDEMENPVHVIETLEPVLNPSSVRVVAQDPKSPDEEDSKEEEDVEGKPIAECAGQGLRDLWKFLHSSSTELRLFLWSQLGLAYDAIDYKTKSFSCRLRSIEMIMADLDGETYTKSSDDSRRLLLLRTLKSLDDQLVQALSMSLNEPSAFDILDEEHFRASTAALAKVNCLLHVATLCEDEIRVGITAAPSNNSTFQAMGNRLREMQVRAWTLQYTLINAAIPQQGSFISPDNERAGLLAAIHQAIGLRKYCKVSNKIFLNLMRRELLRMKDLENWEDYLEQVLYDLYGLKLGVGAWGVQEHGCPTETLQKSNTIQLVERIMILANRMSTKDLLKSELKTTIDHMQQTIGQLKSNAQMIHNLRNFTEYLKKPIHPLRLYRALSGSVDLDAVNVPPRSDALLANHGWFFLLGILSLTKFKGVDLNRRQTPGATDDLRIGATFLRQQLQFTPDRWDAWFRLAECFDYELDEAVLWSADKINKDRSELLKFQRHAIHCYTLALSHSHNVDVEAYEGDPLHDLYHRFGMRMYASSREPFAMEPFQHAEQERFFIEAMGNGTFKRIVHDEMTKYKVWKYAARLFKMAMKRQPNNWKNPFMLAKCYWKMLTTPTDDLDGTDQRARIDAHAVLNAIKKAVEVAYNARKSKRSEPILEPHYKIVSLLHKMVKRGNLPAQEAAAALSEQPFGVPVHKDDHFASFSEPEDWEEYIIGNLTKLRDKDKSNWQHRIIMRHANILFDESSGGPDNGLCPAAKAAFNILSDSMLTKTMVMNVWKCEAERPGRHHVYTERYTRFVTKLLVIMSDRVNMEQLLKRIRKKGADFYHFNDLWHWCCGEFVKVLRKTYNIPDTIEEVFKSMSSEEFEIITERITEWAAGDGPHTAVFSCMRDAIELKKLNGGLTRAGPIDDLINDCYSKIYLDVGDSLPGVEPAKIIEERNKAKEAAAETATNTEADSKPAGALQNLLNPPEGQDSRRTTPTPQESEKPEAGPRARRTGIRRPDVLRKAEQAVVRSMEPKAGPTKSRIGSMSSKRGSQTPVAALSDAGSDEDEGPDAQVRREAEEGLDVEMKDNEEVEEQKDHIGSDGGVDEDGESLEENDGDDESDLSDAPEGSDEEMPPSLMFPNLLRAEAGETSGEEADSGSEGDGSGEEAEEAEEDEEAAEAAEDGEEEDGDMKMDDAEAQEEGNEGSDAGGHEARKAKS